MTLSVSVDSNMISTDGIPGDDNPGSYYETVALRFRESIANFG